MSPLRVTVPIGTRPEIIKLAPVIAALRADGHLVRCIATGQHFDGRMYTDVFAGFGLRPDAAWTLEGTEGERLGQLLAASFAELATNRPDALLVLGDTYTAPLVAVAARRHGVGVIHLEAGLRSFNDVSVEEVNRRMLAALATIHLAPTELARDFLLADGVASERIRVVGNPVIDAIVDSGVSVKPIEARRGILVTAHRATNVDDPVRLAEFVRLLEELGRRHGDVLLPLHPRTADRLLRAGTYERVTAAVGVTVCPPLPYDDLLVALSSSRVVVTDSGGLQEESSFFGVPAVVMRHTTPRWESVDTGAVVLTGLHCDRVLAAVELLTDPAEARRIAALPCPYGTGNTGQRVAEALADPQLLGLLRPVEPALERGPVRPSRHRANA